MVFFQRTVQSSNEMRTPDVWMVFACTRCLAGTTLAALVGAVAACSNGKVAADVLTFSERELRSHAVVKAVPQYPADSHACGVAVSQIALDGNGMVLRRTILQAPDEKTQRAVKLALEQWRFQAIDVARRDRVQYIGKLTFYFKPGNAGTASRAYDPSDTPNIADCIDRDIAADLSRHGANTTVTSGGLRDELPHT